MGLEYENNIVIFEISTLEFVQFVKFCEKIKMHKFGTKNAFFGYCWARILKKLLYYRKSAPLNCLIAKFPGKAKSLHLVPKIPYLDIFGLKFETNFVIFEISTLEFVQSQNFVKKTKMLKFGTNNALFGYS